MSEPRYHPPRRLHGPDKRLNYWQLFIAGGISGTLSRTITAPLDVIKISAQVHTPVGLRGFQEYFTKLYKSEGLGAFWKGNMIACLRLFPFWGVQLTTYPELKQTISNKIDKPYTMANKALIGFVAGAGAGAIATAITYPLDLLKTRFTMNSITERHYTSVRQAVKKIITEEGIFAFYKGFPLSLLGIIPCAGGTLMIYEFMQTARGLPDRQHNVAEHLAAGYIAATISQTFSYPIDTLRKKMQSSSSFIPLHMRSDIDFVGPFSLLRQTISRFGFLSLWAGSTANLIKVVPAVGASFAIFELSKRFFLWANGYTTQPFNGAPKPGVPQSLSPPQLKQWYTEIGSDQPPHKTDTTKFIISKRRLNSMSPTVL